MKKTIFSIIAIAILSTSFIAPVRAADIQTNSITGKSVLAGVLSLIIWPGIGQAVNQDQGKKVVTHAVVGLLPPFRFWSGYDALVRRKGGYWEGRI